MAITFSKDGTSTTINNISFTQSSVTVSIDIVSFSKDGTTTTVFSKMTTYSFPNSNAKMTGNDSKGFSASGSTATYIAGSTNAYYCAFDNNSSTSFTTSSGYPNLILTFNDPTAASNAGLGEVIIKSITIANSSNLSGASIYVGPSSDVTASPMGSGAKVFASVTGNGTYNAPSSLANTMSNCVRIYKGSSSGDTKFGNITITFDVSSSKLSAWKSKYSIS